MYDFEEEERKLAEQNAEKAKAASIRRGKNNRRWDYIPAICNHRLYIHFGLRSVPYYIGNDTGRHRYYTVHRSDQGSDCDKNYLCRFIIPDSAYRHIYDSDIYDDVHGIGNNFYSPSGLQFLPRLAAGIQ